MNILQKDKTPCTNKKNICSPVNVLDSIADELNISSQSPKHIISEAKKVLKCNNEICVLEKMDHKINTSKIVSKYFKPNGPRTTTDLLSNFNIDDVLEQYSNDNPRFYHVFYQMIDFDVVKSELATIDIRKILLQYDSLGVVLNTDTSDGRGVHWFCIYCDLKSRPISLEYFNSSGNLPMPEVHAWLVKTKELLTNSNIPCDIVIASRIMHQQESNTECGPYSLYYIWSRLNGVDHSKFDEIRIPDEKMIEFRQVLFRN
jgi:hypothetical protein